MFHLLTSLSLTGIFILGAIRFGWFGLRDFLGGASKISVFKQDLRDTAAGFAVAQIDDIDIADKYRAPHYISHALLFPECIILLKACPYQGKIIGTTETPLWTHSDKDGQGDSFVNPHQQAMNLQSTLMAQFQGAHVAVVNVFPEDAEFPLGLPDSCYALDELARAVRHIRAEFLGHFSVAEDGLSFADLQQRVWLRLTMSRQTDGLKLRAARKKDWRNMLRTAPELFSGTRRLVIASLLLAVAFIL